MLLGANFAVTCAGITPIQVTKPDFQGFAECTKIYASLRCAAALNLNADRCVEPARWTRLGLLAGTSAGSCLPMLNSVFQWSITRVFVLCAALAAHLSPCCGEQIASAAMLLGCSRSKLLLLVCSLAVTLHVANAAWCGSEGCYQVLG